MCEYERRKKERSEERSVSLTQFYTGVIILFIEVPYILKILTLLYILKSFFPAALGNLNHRIETGEKIFYLHH